MGLAAIKKARNFVCQALYQWQLTEQSGEDILKQFLEVNAGKSFDQDYFERVLMGVIQEAVELDAFFEPYLKDHTLETLTRVECAILRMGTYELMYPHGLSDAAIISESVRLSKRFGSKEGYRFVNAVLDQVAHQLKAE